jgi:hypothetical protein
MLNKTEFLEKASAAYDEWLAQNPKSKNAYDFEKDFEAWFLDFGRMVLEGDKSSLSKSKNKKKKS